MFDTFSLTPEISSMYKRKGKEKKEKKLRLHLLRKIFKRTFIK